MKSFVPFVNGLAAKYTHKRTVAFNLPRPAVSFSFDDFPRSALEHGGSLLESCNVRGTFYAAAGLCNAMDLVACTQRGHELACHTYDHMDCSQYSDMQIAASMEKNQEAIKAITTSALEHFSYPYGRAGLAAKRTAMRYYQSARGTQRGINRDVIDLGLLKASALYSRLGPGAWQPYLHDLMVKPGWLILYTHDVLESPSHYGCTLQELQAVVAQTLGMGYDILTVGEVVRRLTKPPEPSTR